LAGLLAQWTAAKQTYVTRAGYLLGAPGGINGPYFLDAPSLLADADQDILYGRAGMDLFRFDAEDEATDRLDTEIRGE
jgi:hypothetical protein